MKPCKAFSLLLSLFCLVTLFTGCGNQGYGVDLPAVDPLQADASALPPESSESSEGTVIPGCGGDLSPAEHSQIFVDGVLYQATGEISHDPRCGVMDGAIDSSVAARETPAVDNQSNFGTGYSYQFFGADRIDVEIDGMFYIFRAVDSK